MCKMTPGGVNARRGLPIDGALLGIRGYFKSRRANTLTNRGEPPPRETAVNKWARCKDYNPTFFFFAVVL